MARGFYTTFGTAADDVVATTYTGSPAAFSQFCWVWLDALASAAGFSYRIFSQAGDALAFYPFTDNTNHFLVPFSGTDGEWNWDGTGIFLEDSWHSIGMSYDGSSTSNIPTFYFDNTKPTVNVTATPTGTRDDLSGNAWIIGNNQAAIGNRPLNGMLAEFALWNVILTDDEFFALGDGYSPAQIRPASLVEYVPLLRDNISRKNAAPSITGALVQPHPRIIMPKRKRRGAGIAAVPPQVETLFAQACL